MRETNHVGLGWSGTGLGAWSLRPAPLHIHGRNIKSLAKARRARSFKLKANGYPLKAGILCVLRGAVFYLTQRRKARKGINPFTGEATVFKAKPASIAVKVRPLKKLKEYAAS